MTRGKKLLASLLILVLISAAAIVVNGKNNKDQMDATQTATQEMGVTILSVDSEQVISLSWTWAGQQYRFERSEDGWFYAEDPTFPLNESYIQVMLSRLRNLKAGKVLENPADPSEYGLSDPECSVLVTTEAGEIALDIGAKSVVEKLRYLSVGDGMVYLEEGSSNLYSAFSHSLLDVVQEEDIPDMTDIVSLCVKTAEDELMLTRQVTQNETEETAKWFWTLDLVLDSELADAFAENMVNLSWNNCVDYCAEKGELTSYGLEQPEATVTVVYSKEEGQEENFCLEIGSVTENGCYARIGGSNMIYLIDATVGETMIHTTADDLSAQIEG